MRERERERERESESERERERDTFMSALINEPSHDCNLFFHV